MPPSPTWYQTRRFAALALLAAALPLAYPALPPFTDVLGHLGRYRVMLDGGGGPLARWYAFHWRLVGNLGADLLVAGLAPAIGLEPAVKAIAIAIAVATAAACLLLSRAAHGHVSPFALFALPLVYHHAVHLGFLNFTLAMALALLALALWLRLAPTPRRRALLFLAIAPTIWFAHVMGWAALCLTVFAVELARTPRSSRVGIERSREPVSRDIRARTNVRGMAAPFVRCLPLAPPALLVLLQPTGGGRGLTTGFLDPATKLIGLFAIYRDRWLVVDAASIAATLLLLVWAARSGRVSAYRPFLAAAAALAVAVVLLPATLLGSALADIRLAPYALMLALLALRPADDAATRLVARTGSVFAVARLAATTLSLALYDRTLTAELDVVRHIAPEARVLSLVALPCDGRWTPDRRDHIGGVAVARAQAFSNDQWRVPGAPLMTIAASEPYAADPSQLIDCAQQASDPGLRRTIAALPYAAFDYIWLVRPAPGTATPAGTRVWTNGVSALYRTGTITRTPSITRARRSAPVGTPARASST